MQYCIHISFFHILSDSLIPILNPYLFSLNIQHTTAHVPNFYFYFLGVGGANLLNIKKTFHVDTFSQHLLSTLLMHLCCSLKSFWIWCRKSWHSHFWEVLPSLICSTSKAPSGCMGNVGAQPFSDVRSDLSLVSGWPPQGYSDLFWSHSFNVLAVCLVSLSYWKV